MSSNYPQYTKFINQYRAYVLRKFLWGLSSKRLQKFLSWLTLNLQICHHTILMWRPNSSFEDVSILMLSCINWGSYWGPLTSSWGVSANILFEPPTVYDHWGKSIISYFNLAFLLIFYSHSEYFCYQMRVFCRFLISDYPLLGLMWSSVTGIWIALDERCRGSDDTNLSLRWTDDGMNLSICPHVHPHKLYVECFCTVKYGSWNWY